MKKFLLLATSLLLFTFLSTGCFGQSESKDHRDKGVIEFSHQFPEFKIKDDNVQNAEPAILYTYSNHLFSQDKKEEAVVWYYVAQFRNRYLMAISQKDLPIDNALFGRFFQESGFPGNVTITDGNYYLASKDPEYSKLNFMYDAATRENLYNVAFELGEIINPYAFQNVDRHIQRMDEIIAYEKKYPILVENLVASNNLISKEEQQKNKEEIFTGLEEFKTWMKDNKEKIREERSKHGLTNE